jgi:hypothetical protein
MKSIRWPSPWDTPTVEKPAESAQPAPAGKPSALPEDEITRLTDETVTALKAVYDPEIPADIYEIGLIYRIDIPDDNRTVKVDMLLTSPNCPSAQELPVMVIIYGQQRETSCPEIK